MELVKSILTVDGIWENIGGKGYDKAECIPKESWLYVVGKVKDNVIGMVLVHKTPGGLNKCHVQIIPEYRKEHSAEFGIKGMDWIWANTDIDTMVASIPTKYPNVRAYAELQGFVVVKTVSTKDDTMWLLEINRG
jgi:hypothetical protein